MSGDVQPRKRRDKKKKKDDFEETTAHHFHARAPTPPSSNDEVIHVYKETSTGGGICAKIVFFILLSILALLIGLIITEHRGLTDLDTIETETRFSQIFEGWIDKAPESHDDEAHHAIESHEHDDHDEPDDHDDVDDHDHEDEDEHDDDDDEEQASEEEYEEHDEEDDDETAASEVEDDDEPSAQQDDDDDDDEDKSAPEEDEEEDEEDQTVESEQADDDEEDDTDSAPASAEAQVDDDDDDDSKGGDDDDDDDSKGDDDNDDDDDEEKEGDDDSEETAPDSKAAVETQSVEEKNDDGDVDQQKSVEDNNDDDDDDEEENPETGDEDQPGEEAEGDDESNAGVVIKIGVGVTILVVAYVVLVRKWKSDHSNEDDKAESKEIPVDLSRRNTIVVPPKVEEVEQVIDNDDEEYSEEEEEEIKFHPKLKHDYQQLRSTYERSLTPESDPETHARSYDYEDEGEEDVEYDDEEAEDEDNLVEDEDDEVVEGDVEEEEDEEPISDVDDDDLLKKLEAKYGKLEATRVDDDEEEEEEEEEGLEEEEEEDDEHYHWKRSKPGGAQAQPSDDEISHTSDNLAPYEYENLTNDDDFAIKDQLDEAHEHIETNAALAVSLFNNILRQHPTSPRAMYGKAKSLDNLADRQRSNELLKEAITTYSSLLKIPKVPPALFVAAGERCVDRMRFIGQYGRAAVVHNALIARFPYEIKYRNQLAVTYLMSNRINEAREVLQKTLKRWPNDGFALVHYGFILKVNDDKLKESIDYLRKGLRSKAEGVIDGRFYFHLGDALIRLGRPDEAAEVYNEGVENKVFLSFHQRSLYNVNRLTGRPWWEKSDVYKYKNFLDMLESNYLAIKKEGLALLTEKGYFQDEAENLRDVGEWKQFELFARGIKKVDHCKKCPVTCKIVESLPEAIGCRRGQIKFSVMHPGTHVWPHCGPTNCRLRVHLGLKVPQNTFIRVAKETRSWEEGKVLIFDDSFEHEVWHNGTETRLVLIVDVWHPELTRMEKHSLSAI